MWSVQIQSILPDSNSAILSLGVSHQSEPRSGPELEFKKLLETERDGVNSVVTVVGWEVREEHSISNDTIKTYGPA